MKRFLLIALTVVMLAAMMTIPAFAETDGFAAVSSATGAPGETVEVTVSLTALEDANSVGIKIAVPAELELVDGQWLAQGDIRSEKEDIVAGKAAIAAETAKSFNGDVLKLTLKVKDTAAEGEYKVSCTVVVKKLEKELYNQTVQGTVKVEIPVVGCYHDLKKVEKKNPTCQAEGNNAYYVCQKCGIAYKDLVAAKPTTAENEILKKVGHSGGTAKCEEGPKCSMCGEEYGDALDHDYSGDYLSDPNCHWMICPVCKEVAITPKDHVWGEWEETVAATGAAAGKMSRSCETCEYVAEKEIPALTNPFEDVDESHFCFEPVLWAYHNGVTTGKDATHFDRSSPCTRAQVVTFLWRAAGYPEPASSENPFPDVPEGKYYTKAVLWAVEKGITGGFKDGTFGPTKTCTRNQIVTFLWRFAEQPEPQSLNNPFPDVDINAYYGKAVLWAVENGITGGFKDGTFGPNKNCTRDQIVTFLYRHLVK